MYNSDCLEAMAGMEDNSYELAICDPEYGIGVDKMNMGSRKTVRPDNKGWDDKPPPPEYFNNILRVAKNQIIWGGNYFDLPPSRCFLVWDKGETIYGRSFAECEQAWTSFDKPARMFKYPPNNPNRIHTSQKPIALYKWLLKNYANEGARILDTHGGSGSIAIACYDMGFDLDWFEIDTDYYNDAVQRFQNHKAQGQLFEPKQTYKSKQTKLL